MKNSDNKLHIKTDPVQVSVNFDNVTYGKTERCESNRTAQYKLIRKTKQVITV